MVSAALDTVTDLETEAAAYIEFVPGAWAERVTVPLFLIVATFPDFAVTKSPDPPPYRVVTSAVLKALS